MVVLALPFAYLHFRSGGITSYVFGGVLIGISFFLLNNVFGYIGNLQNWWPWLTAAAPGLIYSRAVAGRLRLAGAAAVACMRRARPSSCSAHGSRDPLWRAADGGRGRAAARRCSPASPVRCAYLELDAPDLPAAAAELVARGRRAGHASCRCSWAPASMRAKTCRRWSQAAAARAPGGRLHAAAAGGRGRRGCWTCWHKIAAGMTRRRSRHNEFLS